MNLFGAANQLLGMKESLVFPDHLDKNVVCNYINRFFLRKIEIIREEIDANYINPSDQSLVPPEQSVSNTIERLHSFKMLPDCEVKELLQKSAKRSRKLNPIPSCVLHASREVLLPVIPKIVNASLTLSHFPDEWKES